MRRSAGLGSGWQVRDRDWVPKGQVRGQVGVAMVTTRRMPASGRGSGDSVGGEAQGPPGVGGECRPEDSMTTDQTHTDHAGTNLASTDLARTETRRVMDPRGPTGFIGHAEPSLGGGGGQR